MTHERKKTIIYWVLTTPVMAMMTMSAWMCFSRAPQLMEGLVHLGYPAYFPTILGTAKLLGVLAIVSNQVRVLKEWAYAGFCIDFLGAAASHAFSGDGVGEIVMPFVMLALLLGSYSQWKPQQAGN